MTGDLGTGLAPGDTSLPDATSPTRRNRLRGYWTQPAGLMMVTLTALALAIRLFTLTRSGYMTGVTEYDDGVYLGGAIRLLQGAIPYRDFAYVQPPGILLLMIPVALLTKITTTTHAMAAARLLTAAASATAVPLAGSLVRHRGTLVTLVTCATLAIYPDDLTTAHTLILEPWMNLLTLIAVCLAFRRGRLASPMRLTWAGVMIGAAASVKFWAGVPAFVLLVVYLLTREADGAAGMARGRRTWRYAGGVAAGFCVPVLPFALTAPATFVRSALLDQVTRDGTYVPRSMRLAHITGLVDFLNSRGHLTLTAGSKSLFASGGAAATPATSAGVLPYLVVLAIVIVVFAGYTLRPGRPSPLETFALVTAVIASVLITFYSAFFYHYPDFAAPWLAIAVGGAFGVFGGAGEASAGRAGSAAAAVHRFRRGVAGFVGLAVLLLAIFEASELSSLAAPDIYPDQAVIPAGACVVTDQVSMAISANRFITTRADCPDVLDSLGETLVLSNGVSDQGGAQDLPEVVDAWKSILGRAGYVWLSPNNWRRIPWTADLQAWFDANFTRVYVHGGYGEVYRRDR
ncbi:MAG TPA: hypothetical protein VGG75_07570 [Trebonia sp.]